MKKIDCIVWEITLKCNASCIHCGSAAGQSRINELNTNEVFGIIDQIVDIDCNKINILGGELFLRPDWQPILKRMSDRNLNVSVISNGICLNNINLLWLKTTGITNIGISIDAGTPKTNDFIRGVPGLFEKILNAADKAYELGIDLCAITTINELNILELKILRDLLADGPFSTWQIQVASAHGRMTEGMIIDTYEYYISGLFLARSRKIIDKKTLAIVANHDFGYYSKTIPRHTIYDKWVGCPGGMNTIGIRSDGKVQACLSLDYEGFIENDLRKTTLRELLKNNNFCEWNLPQERYKKSQGFCKECEYFPECLGGCSDVACSLTGNIADNPQCYHRIEKEWQDKEPQNDFEHIFKGLTQSKTDDKGNIYIYDSLLNGPFLNQFNISSHQKALIGLLYDD